MIDVRDMPQDELEATSRAVEQELQRRREQERIPKQMDDLSRQYLHSKGVARGEAWVQPDDGFRAYPKGWRVTHNGETWESTVSGNVWEPGTSGWHIADPVDPNAPAPQWVVPTGAHDSYPKGATVTFGQRQWKSEIDNNVWAPNVHGWNVMEMVTPAPETNQPMGPAEPAAPAWVQPEGAHDAYASGDVVTHNGSTWSSTVDGNVWEPGTGSTWTQIEETTV